MNPVSPIVETKDAKLETLSVTIRALHVSGKQMTLAVFRQLPVAEEKESSEIWGLVRYAIKDEGDVWVVFSSDGTLYRRALRKRYAYYDDWFYREAIQRADKLKSTYQYRKRTGCYRDDELAPLLTEHHAAEKECGNQWNLLQEEKKLAEFRTLRDKRLMVETTQLYIAV